MTTPDITVDLNDADDTSYVWTFLDEACDPAVVVPGATCASSPARSATAPLPSGAPRRPPEPPRPGDVSCRPPTVATDPCATGLACAKRCRSTR